MYPFPRSKGIYGNLNVPGAMLERKLFIRPGEMAQEWDANSGQNSSKCSSLLMLECVSYHLESIHRHTNIDVTPIICWGLRTLNALCVSLHSVLSAVL